MAESTTLTVRLPPQVKDRLQDLAERTRRTRSFLAAEAIDAFVRRELAILSGVEAGLTDMRAGRLVDHEDAMDEVDVAIAEAARR